MKSYILFAFGEYLPESKSIDLIVQFVSQISKKDVRFQHGQSGVIVTFESDLDIHKITKYFEENITILTAMYFVFPIGMESIMSMDDEIYEHLFGDGEETGNENKNEIIDSYFSNSNNTLNIKMAEELFQTLFKDIIHTPSLDELLDKINNVGIENLSQQEIETLNNYSKNIA